MKEKISNNVNNDVSKEFIKLKKKEECMTNKKEKKSKQESSVKEAKV